MTKELFTICMDADGQPVQRSLDAMTATEAVWALDWHLWTSNRAHDEYVLAGDLMTEVRFGKRDPDGSEAIGQIMARSATVIGKHQRLLERVQAILRQRLGEQQYSEMHFSMPLEELVRLHWSGAAQSVS